MHGVYKAFINGIQDEKKGEGGVVYIKGDSCVYMMPHELTCQKMCKAVESFIANDVDKKFLFTLREVDGVVQLHTVSRKVVLQDLFDKFKSPTT